MTHRISTVSGRLITAWVITIFSSIVATSQNRPTSVPTGNFDMFRTAWDNQDLQAIWTTETVTPFERPAESTGKEFLAQEEAATNATISQWVGDSRGHWKGNTLMVETKNYATKTDYRWAQGWRAPRTTLRLVESFTRVDEYPIDYRFTVEDPSMFTTAWTAVIPMSQNRTERGVTEIDRLYEYACHEGNYAMENVLRGARQQDKDTR